MQNWTERGLEIFIEWLIYAVWTAGFTKRQGIYRIFYLFVLHVTLEFSSAFVRQLRHALEQATHFISTQLIVWNTENELVVTHKGRLYCGLVWCKYRTWLNFGYFLSIRNISSHQLTHSSWGARLEHIFWHGHLLRHPKTGLHLSGSAASQHILYFTAGSGVITFKLTQVS